VACDVFDVSMECDFVTLSEKKAANDSLSDAEDVDDGNSRVGLRCSRELIADQRRLGELELDSICVAWYSCLARTMHL
jgi:hypothetical protein